MNVNDIKLKEGNRYLFVNSDENKNTEIVVEEIEADYIKVFSIKTGDTNWFSKKHLAYKWKLNAIIELKPLKEVFSKRFDNILSELKIINSIN